MSAMLIGLIGRKRSGKDTFANVLVERHGFTRLAFADPLKQVALDLDPIVGRPPLPGNLAPTDDVRFSEVIEALGWEKAKDTVPEIRKVLQRLGTAVRGVDRDFWLRTALDALDDETPTVFTDVRFPNEADAIRERGGGIIRISRNLPDDGDTHPSEIALDDYDEDIRVPDPGNRTKEDLELMADNFGKVMRQLGVL